MNTSYFSFSSSVQHFDTQFTDKYHNYRYKSLSASAQDLSNIGILQKDGPKQEKSPTRSVRFMQ